MYKIKRQITESHNVEVIELSTLTSTRCEVSDAQRRDYYFFEVEHKNEVVFTYTDGLVWECAKQFDMVCIANMYNATDEEIEINELKKVGKEIRKKATFLLENIVQAHTLGKIKEVNNLQEGLDALSELSTEGFLDDAQIDFLSLLQYEYCKDFKGEKDLIDGIKYPSIYRMFYKKDIDN